ncbi:MAG: hypothetical protein HON27_13505 [Candidatus Marinimicrobia bacterium]|jgi:hypothetical protein|nr:hypothetical protein [Candidatus Neomarinimicrobiota bacterium]MBT4359661.1 hypothetical protein [Candidatus Neomarinimicrobiota bacterium]MBT4947167.1 hypothetical protein [Candidatus Neomarinimicrobiota bacterium]MBT6010543.1 hypothetical protein [Candidatus Neomarinimicrobiota bacterium]
MYLFKTSGATFKSVIENQKHAFRGKPKEIKPGEIILVSKNKSSCVSGEKQIQYIMHYDGARTANYSEVESLWPGNSGRWNWIIDCKNTKRLSLPFDLQEIIGRKQYSHYRVVQTACRILPDDEKKIMKILVDFIPED